MLLVLSVIVQLMLVLSVTGKGALSLVVLMMQVLSCPVVVQLLMGLSVVVHVLVQPLSALSQTVQASLAASGCVSVSGSVDEPSGTETVLVSPGVPVLVLRTLTVTASVRGAVPPSVPRGGGLDPRDPGNEEPEQMAPRGG